MINFVKRYSVDFSMVLFVFMAGFNFIVLKEAFNYFEPLTFNALRYIFPLPLYAAIVLRQREIIKIPGQDFRRVIWIIVTGPALYQVLIMLGLNLTQTTNSALLAATMPTWVAVFSVMLGRIDLRPALVMGIAITLGGVSLVVLGSRGSGFSLQRDDLVGSGLVLMAAMLLGTFSIRIKPYLDQYNTLTIVIWTHVLAWLVMTAIALPDILTLRPTDFSWHVLPLFLYSGGLVSAGGRLTYNYAIKKLGATRASAYHNFIPLVTAVAAVLLLDEAMTIALVIGGGLTLWGVATVRRHTHEHAPLRRQKCSACGAD